jgi:hypothetical protein
MELKPFLCFGCKACQWRLNLKLQTSNLKPQKDRSYRIAHTMNDPRHLFPPDRHQVTAQVAQIPVCGISSGKTEHKMNLQNCTGATMN